MTTFLLIRHGNSEAEKFAPGRMKGVYLSQSGKEQVKQLSQRLLNVSLDKIFSSPVDRTVETAEIIGKQIGLDYSILDDLSEIEIGDFTGKNFDELDNNHIWQLYHEVPSITRFPGGEHILQTQKRMISCIEKLCSEYPHSTIALISHGDPIKSVIAFYSGIPLDFIMRLVIFTASVSVISVSEHGSEILCVNDTDGIPFVRKL